MSDSDSDREGKQDADIPPYRVRHSDLNIKLVKEIVRCIRHNKLLELDSLFKKYTLEKDVCVELIKYLKS